MPAELLRVWVFFALCVGCILAAPIDTANPTTTTYGTKPGLQATIAPEPPGRGTFRIVFSCSATFFFCIWTAVHPNVIGGTTRWHRLFYKATLMLLAIFLPEGLIMFAVAQRREAKEILDYWVMVGENERDDLGMEGAFFVLMGGFYVQSIDTDGKNFHDPNINDPNLKKLKPSEPKPACTVTLTAKGFKGYVKAGYLHSGNINKKLILDKGKSNNIAKVLAGSQALWLCVQCMARWAQSLPMTLLEIHVAIQVLTTLVIYSLWWYKPLDVNEPIEIELKKSDSSTRFFPLLVTNANDVKNAVDDKNENNIKNEDHDKNTDDIKNADDVGNTDDVEKADVKKADNVEDKHNLETERKYTKDHWKKPHKFITKTPPSNIVAVFCQTNYEILAPIVSVKGTEKNTRGSGRGRGSMIIEGLLVALSGALHAGSWNLHFPTPVEALLWRISALGMLVLPLGAVFMAGLGRYHRDLIYVAWRQYLCNKGVRKWFWECLESIHCMCISRAIKDDVDSTWDRYASKLTTGGSTAGNAEGRAKEEGITSIRDCHANGESNTCSPKSNEMNASQKVIYATHLLGIATTLLFLLGYFASILYITVESYISIRNPPAGAFLTPTWSNYWPHL